MGMWKKCASWLQGELPAAEYNTWILPLQSEENADRIVLYAPNRFVKDWVVQHYAERILAICTKLNDGQAKELTVQIGSARPAAGATDSRETRIVAGTEEDRQEALDERRKLANLQAGLSFDTFVEGRSNEMARAASVQIGRNPGAVHNPLFIYGGVGLGKTHLMHAVGNLVLEGNPNMRVVYLHSERFVGEMIRSLQQNKIDEFKRKYRSVNTLLIDDVQFFAGKERSQEEFFHTFNALFESRQQIVLSSDRFPKEVSGLEERLKSRFGWGLTVSIDPPDLETRVAILHSKASMRGLELPEDVAFFVARKIRSNVRDIEGALQRLMASTQFMGKRLTLDLAKEGLRDMIASQDKQVTIENIQKMVAQYYSIRTVDLVSSKRSRSIARPRQMAMALAKELTTHSLPEIGSAFGGRDHTTVLHATRKIKSLREAEASMEEDYRNLLRSLTS